MIARHDTPPLNIFRPAPVGELNLPYVAKLSRLVLRAQLTRRSTTRAVVNIRSAMQFSYAMAGTFFSGMELDGQRQLAGLSIYRGGRRSATASAIKKTAMLSPQKPHRGKVTYHHDQARSPDSLVAMSASVAAASPSAAQ